MHRWLRRSIQPGRGSQIAHAHRRVQLIYDVF